MRPREHTDSQFENDLHQLRNALLYMGGEIEKSITDGMRALLESNEALARQTIQRDHLINCLEVEIDDLCLKILALRQPAASDLRFITTTLKIVTDLERIGDLASHVAERAAELSQQPRLGPYLALGHMAELAQQMLKDALDAFVQRDADLAEKVIALDSQVDQLNSGNFRELLKLMTDDPKAVARGISLINVSKYVERIGDHATNIAEMVIFMVRGKDVRHLHSRQEQNRGSS